MSRGIFAVALATFVAVAAACGGTERAPIGAPEGKAGPLGLRLQSEDGPVPVLAWDDQEDETEYRVSGSATYWPRCDNPFGDEVLTFAINEALPADSTSFTLPEASDSGDFFLKELVANVLARAAGGSEVRDGIAFTGEPPPCD